MRTEDTYEIHYVYKDHLGSWTTITNAGGVVEREQSFDAWGNMRDPETWSCDYDNTPMFDRGFTGHEHLHMFGLINMNGRMYDPTMSSFLSVDNFVQAPDFSQSFNRYSYCLNNPLKFVDPSGWQMVGGMKPNPFHENWSVSHVAPTLGPSAFVNPYNLLNMALYGNLYGPNEVVGGGGSMDALYGSYGHYVTHQANSVLNYTFPSTQLHLIRNWHNNPCHSTNSDVRDAGITNVSVGEVNYGGGLRTSFYSWKTASGQEKSASVWYESVGGNSKGTGALSLQPLAKYENSILGRSGVDNTVPITVSTTPHYLTVPDAVSVVGGQATMVQSAAYLTGGKVFSTIGKTAGIISGAISIGTTTASTINRIKYINNGGDNTIGVATIGVTDIAFTIAGFYWPWGTIASTVYFSTEMITDDFWEWGKVK